MSEKFTLKAQSSLAAATNIAREMGHSYVGTEHLLLGILSVRDCVAYKILNKSGVIESQVRREVENISGVGTFGHITSNDMTPGCRRIIEMASVEYQARGQRFIGTEHILFALLNDNGCVAYKILEILLVDTVEIRNNLEAYFASRPDRGQVGYAEADGVSKDKKGTKMLSTYGRDMTQMAAMGSFDKICGRDEETIRVIQILSRRTKNNPCLVGEAGVGKTAIVEGIAQRIADGNVPDDLRGYKLYSVDIGSMIAGAKYRGEFEERFKGLISEVKKNNDIILFIDEIHTIVGAGAAEGALDAANIIKPILARGELKVIGATTLAEYKKHIEKDSALERRFQPVFIAEPSPEKTVEIIRGILSKYEEHHGIKIGDDAVIAAVAMSKRYINNRFLPDKAIDLIDESAARVRIAKSVSGIPKGSLQEAMDLDDDKINSALLQGDLERVAALRNTVKCEDENPPQIVLTREDIAKTLSLWTGIPISQILSSEKEKLYSLPERLNERIIGQTEAVNRVCRALLRSRSGIGDSGRPLASFLFAGPTGVGKTRFCYELALELFGDGNNIIRLDMSEYMERHSVSKLIGSPPGYIGYEESGFLTERVRRKPYSIVLFDEIEKAHPDVYNLLLQILDDGALSDSHGMSVDFKNTVIIMTSNVGGSQMSATPLGFGNSASINSKEAVVSVREKIKKHFPSEFLNRIDDIIVFNFLDDASIRIIIKNMLDKSVQGIRDNGIEVSYSNKVVDLIMNADRNKSYGAREIKRLVTSIFEDEYIESYYNNKFSIGNTLYADVKDGKVVFEVI